ncbi:protein ImuA [Sphingomonas sp. BN140010]|uniref:Protein ImuA n=1 Tax=Sphingomonas arvum TaxID=2992113 RepID=A0ABT3JAU9_9SPHN|nr:protein ImuA [Sphingomonas sp. BN140010]MCW3796206.1 protein ImuA [Sphingomonas sp. BN140010]
MSGPSSPIAELRESLRAITGDVRERPVLPFGIAPLDDRLASGGLRLDALHEVSSRGSGWGDDAAAVLFVAGVAARTQGDVLWVVRSRDLFAPGLYQAGLAPSRVIYAEARDDAELLALLEEGLRHRGLGAVVGEARRLQMAQARRLQLAAETGDTPALLLRRSARDGADPLDAPSAAVTRWRIGHAPSLPVPWDGLGPACWRVECVRQRGGEPFELLVEGSDEAGRLALPAQLVDRPVAQDRAPLRAVG